MIICYKYILVDYLSKLICELYGEKIVNDSYRYNIASKKELIPENMSIEEASEFWDAHSVADYSSHVVKIVYRPEEQITFVAVANDLLLQLEQHAKKQGASIETLINLWIKEKLTA
jgi:hypothetical protein